VNLGILWGEGIHIGADDERKFAVEDSEEDAKAFHGELL